MQTILPQPLQAIDRTPANRRILIVDDNEAIHGDFRKILCNEVRGDHFSEEFAAVFGRPLSEKKVAQYEMEFALQGERAVQLVQEARDAGARYAVAFIDVRMPPGMDGLETSVKLWELDPDLQIVICTAYSDYSWDEMMEKITNPAQLLILKKPFDAIEVQQIAKALTDKWSLIQEARRTTHELERMVSVRTFELQAANAMLQREITERKQHEAQIQEQATLLDQARDAILVRDLDGRVIFWSEGAQRLYGWTREEAVGRTAQGLFYDDLTDYDRATQSTVAEGGWTGELEQKTKAGALVTVEGHWTLVRDEQGRPKSILAINSDVTEKNRMEAHLLQTQRMECVGTLAGGIAHNLNNVLCPIVMATEYLKLKFGDAESDTLTAIQDNAARASELVRQVLSFARGYEGNHVQVQPKYILNDIRKIAEEIFPKNITLKFTVEPNLWNVCCDPAQIHQALLNLCINARDAMPQGGRLEIHASNLQLDQSAGLGGGVSGPYVVLQVADSGPGIPADTLGKIFDPFFTTREIGKGAGLGLSTALSIVKSHQGFISSHSEVGQGSSFKIHLPAAVDAVQLTKSACPSLPRGNGELILVIDDEAPIRQITQRVLVTFGYDVMVASDGVEGVALYARHHGKIAAVITDMMMPVMDGAATIEAITRINPQAKVIAASGIAATRESPRMAELGVKHFLAKPCAVEALLGVLADCLGSISGKAAA